jgi:hypothetical protein
MRPSPPFDLLWTGVRYSRTLVAPPWRVERRLAVIVELKKCCRGCQKHLPFAAFSPHARAAYGLQPRCVKCRTRYNVRYRRATGDVNRKACLYAVSKQCIEDLLRVPCCQACGKKFPAYGKERIDHCHFHGHVRGVVCNRCNVAMSGSAEESLHRLRGCIQYLERDAEWQSLEVSCPG